MKTIAQMAHDLNSDATTSRVLVEATVERITQHRSAGGAACVHVDIEKALADAMASDQSRAKGKVLSPLPGLPVSIKDLLDVQGQTTRARSQIPANAPPTPQDATAVSRLRAAGAILLGRTNMNELAFSGLGLNPHYGTPRTPHYPQRIAGGSSSGAEINVAEGMAVAAMGTDTGGSIRIPSVFCGVTGFKPTARRAPMEGTIRLSQSLNSVGPLAGCVAGCLLLDAILSSTSLQRPVRPLAGLRLGGDAGPRPRHADSTGARCQPQAAQ